MSTIRIFPSGPLATNAIVVADDEGSAALFDVPSGCVEPVADYLVEEGLRLEKIFLTHSHWDHIADCAAAKMRFHVPIFVHPLDAPNLERPGSDGIPIFLPYPIPGVVPDGFLQEGQLVKVGRLTMRVMHTPGHCPGLVCFYCMEENLLICGDLLFHGTIGTLAVPTAEPEKMWVSLDRIANLPPATRLFPGHGEPTTIQEEEWLPRAKEIFGG